MATHFICEITEVLCEGRVVEAKVGDVRIGLSTMPRCQKEHTLSSSLWSDDTQDIQVLAYIYRPPTPYQKPSHPHLLIMNNIPCFSGAYSQLFYICNTVIYVHVYMWVYMPQQVQLAEVALRYVGPGDWTAVWCQTPLPTEPSQQPFQFKFSSSNCDHCSFTCMAFLNIVWS